MSGFFHCSVADCRRTRTHDIIKGAPPKKARAKRNACDHGGEGKRSLSKKLWHEVGAFTHPLGSGDFACACIFQPGIQGRRRKKFLSVRKRSSLFHRDFSSRHHRSFLHNLGGKFVITCVSDLSVCLCLFVPGTSSTSSPYLEVGKQKKVWTLFSLRRRRRKIPF